MNREDIQLRFCKYKISHFAIVIPNRDEPFVLDEAHIGNWSIEKDFENYFFPFMEFRCMVPDTIYTEIMQTSEDVYVDLKVEYAYFEDTYEMDPAAMLFTYDKLLESRYYAFIANRSPKLTDALLGEKDKDAENEPNEWTQYSYDNQKSLVMALYKPEHVFKTNQIVNAVLGQATPIDAVCWILQKIEAEHVLMTPVTSAKKFDQMIIPPLSAPQAIMYVINHYGLYEDGAIVFFDYDRCFINSKKLGCTAYNYAEHHEVYLTSFPASSDQSVMKSGYYFNNEEKYLVINILGNSISISNESMFVDQLTGGNIVGIDSNTGEVFRVDSEVNVSDQSLSKKGVVNRVVVIDSGETSTINSLKTSAEQSQNLLNIVVENINIQALLPNKDYIFTTDNVKYQQYQGHYRITNMSAAFTKESQFYSCFCTATFMGGQKQLS